MKIIKPQKLGLLHRTYSHRGEHFQAVAALCFYRLGSADILPEALQWHPVMEVLGSQGILDMAMPKPRGEYLLAGSACAPPAAQVESMLVEVEVGGLSKTLRVSGDRSWRSALSGFGTIDRPVPFSEMPLDYQGAFGGEGFDENTAGKGFCRRRDVLTGKVSEVPLPNIEYPDQVMQRLSKRPQVAGLGPVALTVPSRRDKAGTYDENWQQNTFPGLADDIDWSLFNAAPEDQQLPGYWADGERYRLRGVHPELMEIVGQLPQLVARAFVQSPSSGFTEVDMERETLWFFPGKMLGVLIFRGYRKVQDPDGEDVAQLMLAYENSDDPRRPLSHYQEVLRLRTGEDTALAHVFNESQLSPEKSDARLHAEAAEVEAERQRRLAMLQQLTAEMDLPEAPAEDTPDLEAVLADAGPVIAPEAIARGDVDMSALHAHVEEKLTKTRTEGEAALESLRKDETVAPVLENGPPPPEPQEQGRETLERAGKQLSSYSGQPYQPPQDLLDDDRIREAGLDPEQLRRLGFDPTQETNPNAARRLSPEPAAPAAPLHSTVQVQLRLFVSETLMAGGTLASRDLAGADLSGMDFSGADLREVLLEQADLSHCNFSGADLSRSALTGACLDGADFRRARLSGANLCKSRGLAVNFSAADFAGAMLCEAHFQDSVFDGSQWRETLALKLQAAGASFQSAKLVRVTLNQAGLRQTDWTGADISQSFFLESDLYAACFAKAQMFRCAMMKINARLISFKEAELERVQMGGAAADFCGADLSGISAEQCGFRDTDFRAASFAGAGMHQCDLGLCDIAYGDFRGGRFNEVVLSGSDLGHSMFSDAAYTRGLARKCTAREADFSNSNFFGSDFQYASWRDCGLDSVRNLHTTAMEVRP